MSGPANKPRSGMDAVLQMRDEFLQFVTACNVIGEYRWAMDAQAIAIALHGFENDHHITEIAWPPKVINEPPDSPYLEPIDREATRCDPNAPFRWLCPKCTTANGIDDAICLGGSCGEKRPDPQLPIESIEEVHAIIEAGRNGVKAEAEYRGKAIKAWIGLAVEWFRENGGNNYVIMDISDERDGQQYTFTVQRKGGISPNEAITKLTAEKAQIPRRVMDTFKQLIEFYSDEQIVLWLESPQDLLSDRIPIDLLLTEEGTKEVWAVVARLRDGAHI